MTPPDSLVQAEVRKVDHIEHRTVQFLQLFDLPPMPRLERTQGIPLRTGLPLGRPGPHLRVRVRVPPLEVMEPLPPVVVEWPEDTPPTPRCVADPSSSCGAPRYTQGMWPFLWLLLHLQALEGRYF